MVNLRKPNRPISLQLYSYIVTITIVLKQLKVYKNYLKQQNVKTSLKQ